MSKRKACTNCLGGAFSKDRRDEVWRKRERHPWGDDWGKDRFGNLINLHEYGKAAMRYGWDIDHSKPVSRGGKDHLNNLQPMQSYYNRHIKSDNYPWGDKQHERDFKGLPKKLKK